jgi:uncharacterized protein (DUF2252 family)
MRRALVKGLGTSGPTPDERAALGKAARAHVPRSSHAEWKAPVDRPDPVSLLEAQAVTRVPELVPVRYGRMLASPFAFFRGAALIMTSDLSSTPRSGLDAQICGDAHLANFGAFGSPERELVFDVNDFDETLPGPWEWDLKRLGASLAVAGRSKNFSDVERTSIVRGTGRSYRQAMRSFCSMGDVDVWYLRMDMTRFREWADRLRGRQARQLRAEQAKAESRDSLRAFAKLTTEKNGRVEIKSDPPLLVRLEELSAGGGGEEVTGQLDAIFEQYCRSLPDDRRRLLASFRRVDIARKVVGVGSVGTRCWVLLLVGRTGRDPLFLQFKEAEPSVLESFVGRSEYPNHGQRVVEGQRLMQAASDILLGWVRVKGLDQKTRDFYGRQLWDWKGSANLELMGPREMGFYGEMCGWMLARAHARSGDRFGIAGYLGSGDTFDRALAEFSEAYADQSEADYRVLLEAARTKRVTVETGL